MRRTLGLMLAFLAILTGWGSPLLAAGEGVISGQVVNKTAGGTPVGAVEVTLVAYSGKAAVNQQNTLVDTAGRFKFQGLSVEPGTTYTLRTTFQDADYASQIITLTPTSPTQEVELDVYDSTTTDENIQVSNGHIVVFADKDGLEVLEVWRFNNVGNKTFIGTKGKTTRTTLQFTLPQGATSLYPGQGFISGETDSGLAYTAAVPPGITDVSFTYIVPYEGSSVKLSRKTDYPIADFRLMVQDTGVKVTSVALTPAAPQTLNGTNYLNFTAGNLAKGVDLDASFSEIAKPSDTSSLSLWLLAGVALVGLMAIIIYALLKKRQMVVNPTSPTPLPRVLPAPGEEDALLRELARLDDAYEAGTIKEKEYRTRRAQIKASLIGIYDHARTHEPE